VDDGFHTRQLGERRKIPHIERSDTQEAPRIKVHTSLPGLRVAQGLNGVAQERGLLAPIQVEDRPEFKSIRVFDHMGTP
jgi:hypothetical protein